jgi:hypothetical protein
LLIVAGARGEIDRHVRCNALKQCVDSLKLPCVYIEQVWMAGQRASPYVRYGTKVTVKKRVRVQHIRQTIQVLRRTSSTPEHFVCTHVFVGLHLCGAGKFLMCTVYIL